MHVMVEVYIFYCYWKLCSVAAAKLMTLQIVQLNKVKTKDISAQVFPQDESDMQENAYLGSKVFHPAGRQHREAERK